MWQFLKTIRHVHIKTNLSSSHKEIHTSYQKELQDVVELFAGIECLMADVCIPEMNCGFFWTSSRIHPWNCTGNHKTTKYCFSYFITFYFSWFISVITGLIDIPGECVHDPVLNSTLDQLTQLDDKIGEITVPQIENVRCVAGQIHNQK